ncbi:MAG: SH3 domain-containing protein [Anaerolineae bacterium]|nr:MAG: SH3 domain-containing protein [Anaerolineae bacterium]
MKRLFLFSILAFTLALALYGGTLTARAENPTATPSPSGTPAASPTPTPTFTPSPTPEPVKPVGWALVNVPPRGVLRMRSWAGTEYRIVGALAPQQKDVPLTGVTWGERPRIWYQVRRSGGGVGWISSYYVVEYVPPADFCRDTRVEALLTDLTTAIKNEDGEALSALVSPMHGMTVRLAPKGVSVNYLRYVPYLFTSTYPVNWGRPSAASSAVIAPFKDAFGPRLQAVFGTAYEKSCNDASKVSGVEQPWPEEYANVNFYTLYVPPKEGESTGRAWLVGVDYVDGKPYVFALLYYGP